jgi:hypothetical protein
VVEKHAKELTVIQSMLAFSFAPCAIGGPALVFWISMILRSF